jgi:hypothetical protein
LSDLWGKREDSKNQTINKILKESNKDKLEMEEKLKKQIQN